MKLCIYKLCNYKVSKNKTFSSDSSTPQTLTPREPTTRESTYWILSRASREQVASYREHVASYHEHVCYHAQITSYHVTDVLTTGCHILSRADVFNTRKSCLITQITNTDSACRETAVDVHNSLALLEFICDDNRQCSKLCCRAVFWRDESIWWVAGETHFQRVTSDPVDYNAWCQILFSSVRFPQKSLNRVWFLRKRNRALKDFEILDL